MTAETASQPLNSGLLPPPTNVATSSPERRRSASRLLVPRKLTAGGIRSGVLTLAAQAMGTGPLALPYAMKATGLVLGIVLLMVTSCVAVLGGDMLIRCAAEQQQNIVLQSPQSLPQGDLRARQLAVRSWTYLLEKHFGKRASVLLDSILALLGCGLIVMYLVFMVQFIDVFLANIGISTMPPREALIIGCAVLAFPPSLLGNLGAMRFMALFIFCVLMVVCCLTTLALATCEPSKTPVELVKFTPTGMLKSFCIFFFSQMYHFNLYTIFAGLQPPYEWSPNFAIDRSLADVVRMRKIIRRTVFSTWLVSATIAVTGYLTWRADTAEDIILTYTHEHCPPTTMVVALIVQALLIVMMVVSIPLNVVPTRLSLLNLLEAGAGERVADRLRSPPGRHLLTGVLIALMASLAMVLDSVADIISFLSGSVGTIIAFLLPFLFYKWSQVNKDEPCIKGTSLAVLGACAVVGFGNVALQVLSPH
eukprot:TRINITY_DN11804_c0_g1_i1.p1 TRINITY_DN11804_c0_g1~~TRINITY_DN11804_c0_g1_i1.p1  ORF type:complete len:507 (+),score=89.94 TRINITY_DN11804_c0_g1_i1:90-1523(+)